MYSEGMRRCADLWLVGVTLRLKAGNGDVQAAARKWEDAFGVKRGEGGDGVVFTNAEMCFVKGEVEMSEGLVEVGIAVEGRGRRDDILDRARKEGLSVDGDVVQMLGVKWKFILRDLEVEKSKL